MASPTGGRATRSSAEARVTRRQEYIDAAATVFYQRGYDSATIGDIAERLDVTKAAIYYYVESKEDLLYEIIREMHLLNLENLERSQARTGSALSRLWHYFDCHIRVNLEHVEKTAVVYRDLDHLSIERRGLIVALRDETQQYVRDLLEQAIAEGAACALLDVELASIQMFSAVNAMYGWYHLTGPLTIDELSSSLTDFVLGSVSCSGTGDVSCPRHHPVVRVAEIR